ncbi:MAG TPA: hypothetical protein VGH01_11270 [Jatrophihabitantaceae bacterium]|jgi:hypothetical protein
MTDMERLLSGALHAQAAGVERAQQAQQAQHTALVSDAADVVVLGDYPGRGVPRRHGYRPTLRTALGASVAAAAVAALAGGLVAMAAGSGHGTQHPAVSAAGRLTSAAVTSASPYGLAPGQYLHVHAGTSDTWIPADPSGAWVLVSDAPPELQSPGSAAPPPSVRETAKCGAFQSIGGYPGEPFPGCTAAVGWLPYRPQFAQSLPSDPAAIRASLAAFDRKYDAPPTGSTYTDRSNDDMWSVGDAFLSTGYAPNSVALAVIDALRGVPGVTVLHHVSNGSGQFGDAISYQWRKTSTNHGSDEVIFDPVTGQVIGTGGTWSLGSVATAPITYTVTTKTG